MYQVFCCSDRWFARSWYCKRFSVSACCLASLMLSGSMDVVVEYLSDISDNSVNENVQALHMFGQIKTDGGSKAT